MAVKSVIEIDVLDDKFKAFSKEVEKVKKTLEDLKVNQKELNEETEKGFEEAQETIEKTTQELEKVQKTEEKLNKTIKESNKSLKDTNKSLKDSTSSWKNIQSITTNISNNISKMTTNMGKYLAFSALAGGFGIFGLSYNATNIRKTSTQYGVSAGALRAFRESYGGAIPELEGSLSNIATLQSSIDPKDVLARNLLGISPSGKPETQFSQAIERAVQLFKQDRGIPQLLEYQGVTKFIPYDVLRGLVNRTKEEREGFARKFAQGTERYRGEDEADIKLQELTLKLKQANQSIENNFIKALAPVTPQLVALAGALTKLLVASIKIAGFFANIAGKYLPSSSNEAINNANKADIINYNIKKKTWEKEVANQLDPNKRDISSFLLYKSEPLGIRNLNPGNLKFAGQSGAVMGEGGFARFSSIDAGEIALANQLKLYQTRDHLDTLSSIIKKYAPSSDQNDTEAYIKDVAKQTGFSPTEKINLQDTSVLAKLMSAISQHETGRTFPAQSMQILVNNASGSDLNATMVANAPIGR